MNPLINKALNLRKSEKLKESNQLLLEEQKRNPKDAFLNYQVAWSYDLLEEERKAISFYEKAIELGLNGEDLGEAYLGLGSTYRAIGNYQKSFEVFTKGIQKFPDSNVLQVFYAMTLFNCDQSEQAMEILLRLIATTSNDGKVQKYKRAILYYSDKLAQKWPQ